MTRRFRRVINRLRSNLAPVPPPESDRFVWIVNGRAEWARPETTDKRKPPVYGFACSLYEGDDPPA